MGLGDGQSMRSISFLPPGVSRLKRNRRRGLHGIMGVPVFIVKHPPSQVKIYLVWFGVARCFEGFLLEQSSGFRWEHLRSCTSVKAGKRVISFK